MTPTTTRMGVLTLRRRGRAARPAGAGARRRHRARRAAARDRIVDTPGTNAVAREHEALTREFVPRSDLVLFVTSADRPFTESERAFLQSDPRLGQEDRGGRQQDRHPGDATADRARWSAFVGRQRARTLLGVRARGLPGLGPPGPARQGAGDAAALAASGFDGARAVRRRRRSTRRERVRLKLLNPLGVGLPAAGAAPRQHRGARCELLRGGLRDRGRHRAASWRSTARTWPATSASASPTSRRCCCEFERRGLDFFDDTLRIGRIFDLAQPVAGSSASSSRRWWPTCRAWWSSAVDEVIDWMVASDMRQWQAVMRAAGAPAAEHADRMRGPRRGRASSHDRARLLETRAARGPAGGGELRPGRGGESAGRVRADGGGEHRRAAGRGAGPGDDRDHARDAPRRWTSPASWPRARSPSSACWCCPARRAGAKTELRAKVDAMRDAADGRAHAAVRPASVERSLQRLQEAIGALHAVRARRARALGYGRSGSGPDPGRAGAHPRGSGSVLRPRERDVVISRRPLR